MLMEIFLIERILPFVNLLNLELLNVYWVFDYV